jgi:hypothetical protein
MRAEDLRLPPRAYGTNEKSRSDGRLSRESLDLTVAVTAQPPIRAVPWWPSLRTQWTVEP